MEKAGSNTYRFHCEVVEIISSGENPAIKLVCKPGSMIIQVPYDQITKLGDRFLITGNLELISKEKDL